VYGASKHTHKSALIYKNMLTSSGGTCVRQREMKSSYIQATGKRSEMNSRRGKAQQGDMAHVQKNAANKGSSCKHAGNVKKGAHEEA
jgi:hypothetical protein